MKIRCNVIEIDVKKIKPNRWNPNQMTDFIFEKERNSIRKFGFLDPILVRKVGAGWEIIDGEHRWRAATAEGFKKIPANDLGKVDESVAKQLTVIANETRGQADRGLLTKLYKDLEADVGLDELVENLPVQREELESLLVDAAVNWDEISAKVEQPPPPEEKDRPEHAGGAIALEEPQALENRVVGETSARFEQIRIDKDVWTGLHEQIKRINKALAEAGQIPKEELKLASNSLAFQVVTQILIQKSDKELKELLRAK